ncbi:hypothetical protein FDP41_000668 [Naegleria fowleri]|uniref:Uncharacterized protein n=1 Tax=Naegleria fowleri TaxID=5763 RepID=A0A6A5CHK0_NAEFO|nr:uncharacterized protein FDP41_000668 [Naegleria fowleri]KAF0984769.1 hypothetical protein FDP41_000668 [Naegleria fowleri]CAG4716436.1 unnamed protein product [Naegleria fowleri]
MFQQQDREQFGRQFTELVVRHRQNIRQYEKMIEEFKTLYDTLIYIPQKLQHHSMLPIGSHGLAFMPGQLIQTNEVTVALGENYFIKTSAHHARQILKRRIERVLNALENERKLLHGVYEGMGLGKHSHVLKPKQEKLDLRDVSEAEKIEQMIREMESQIPDELKDLRELEESEEMVFEYNSRKKDRDELHYRRKTTPKDEEDLEKILNELEREEMMENKMKNINLHDDEEEKEELQSKQTHSFGEEDKKLQQDILKYFHRTKGASTEATTKQQLKPSQSTPSSMKPSSGASSFNIMEREVVGFGSPKSMIASSSSSSQDQAPKKVSKFKQQRMMENK